MVPLQPNTPVKGQTPGEAQDKRKVGFALPNDHVDRDSSQWQKITAKPGFLDAVLPDQVETRDDSPRIPALATLHATTSPQGNAPRVRQPKQSKRKPPVRTPEPHNKNMVEQSPSLDVPPPPPAVSNQHFEAIDETSQACYVTYMYGSNQAMVMTVKTMKSGKPFDPCSVDLPSIGALVLVGFYHASVGFPVKQTWLNAIKAGNFNSLPGLTYANAAKYCPDADETIKNNLAQQRQNV